VEKQLSPIIYIVDDDISVRESLQHVFSSFGFTSRTFVSAPDFLSHPQEFRPSCLVLDVRLPGISGLDLQRRVDAERFATPVIFITAFADVPITVQAMKAGALEFLTKPIDIGHLMDAVVLAIAHSSEMIARTESLRSLQRRHATLSRREKQVMSLVTSGLMNKQVGWELGICEITVKAHRGRLMRKMNATSLAELVRMAGSLGAGSAVDVEASAEMQDPASGLITDSLLKEAAATRLPTSLTRR
jgi:FixJ family two-component response regulator